MLAASLVSLFVVVLGSTPSHAAATRVGAVVSNGSTTQAGPVDVSTSPDVDAVGLDLAGLPPAMDRASSATLAEPAATTVAAAPQTRVASPSVRGPPAR